MLAILKKIDIIKLVDYERGLSMNKEELVQEIAKKAKMTQKDVTEVVNGLMATIQKTVAKGNKVTLV